MSGIQTSKWPEGQQNKFQSLVSPHYNIVSVYSGAQRLVEQDSPVAHNDAFFTAETESQERQRLVKLKTDR